MEFFFADDSRQETPTRPGMGSLVGIGGIYVPDEKVKKLEREIEELCCKYGFPPGEEFKWSPGREFWMWANLTGENRQHFFTDVLNLCKERGVQALVVVEDKNFGPAIKRLEPEMDVATLFLERVNLWLRKLGKDGVIIVDRISGDRRQEYQFLSQCLETLQSGTNYVKPEKIAINILSTPSKLIRLLQIADLVTSCTISIVAGETRYAPPVFNYIKEILIKDRGRIGGVGLKIHPNTRYVNLYHWILGDDLYIRGNAGAPLPLKTHPYSENPIIL